jgi:hypothetical protein
MRRAAYEVSNRLTRRLRSSLASAAYFAL